MRTFLCAMAVCLAAQARADIVLDIDGPTSLSATNWTLSGGDTATGAFAGNYFEYTGVGAFYPSTFTFNEISGSATLTNATTLQAVNIDTVFISDANGGTVGFNLSAPFVVSIGNTINASSTAWQFLIDEESLSFDGPLPYTSLDNISSSGVSVLDISIGTTNLGPSAVPEASSFLFGGVAVVLASIGWLRSRRRVAT